MTILLIIGGGGHAKVVTDVALSLQKWTSFCYLDDRFPVLSEVLGFPVLGTFADLSTIIASQGIKDVFVALGNSFQRLKWLKYCEKLEVNLPTLVHSSAVISRFAKVERGVLIMPNSVVNCEAKIGMGSIINTAAIIEHDCILEESVHISPNATLAGGVQVGRATWVGINASIKENVCLGENVIVGAGSAVIDSVKDNKIVAGVPAKEIKQNDPLSWG